MKRKCGLLDDNSNTLCVYGEHGNILTGITSRKSLPASRITSRIPGTRESKQYPKIRVGSLMIGWERIQGGKADLKRWVLSFERNVETDNELRVSGGWEFQSLGAMTEKALLPRDVRTYGMDRTDKSDDLVDRE